MRFVLLAWLLSRLLVVGVLLGAGHVSAAVNWDGAWYGSIVAHGYEYAPDGKQHNIAFFPLLPLVAWPLVHAGISWPLAALLVSNAAFLGALVLIYQLATHAYDETAARWSVLVACLLPPSLFCSVGYPQSLFMLLSALALSNVVRGRFTSGGLAAGLASSASALGIPLAAGLVVNGIVKRDRLAVVSALLGFAGVAASMLYCQVRFHDALAFVHTQSAWRHGFRFDYLAWQAMLYHMVASIDGFRQYVAMLIVPLGIIAVVVESRRLGTAMTAYALLALVMLLCSGVPFSVDRNAYAVVPVLLSFGAILRRVPALGYAVLAISAVVLVVDAGRFAHFQWVA